VIFYPSDIIRLPTGTNRFKGNEHLILRYDRTLLDASPPSLALVPGAAKSCPLAVGHRVNHPPPGSDANVLACAFDLSIKEVPSELHELLPNVRFQQVEWDLLRKGDEVDRARAIEGTKGRGGLMAALDQMVRFSISEMGAAEAQEDRPLRMLALVASRDIEDEEVFLNYRLNPATKATWPSWYVPYAKEEAERRWS